MILANDIKQLLLFWYTLFGVLTVFITRWIHGPMNILEYVLIFALWPFKAIDILVHRLDPNLIEILTSRF